MPNVELITGPAGAGKTKLALSTYRDEVRERQKRGEFGTALWITPSQRSRRSVLSSLTTEDLPVCFAPQVVTFDEFAERLLASAPEAVRPISQTTKKKLLRDLIDRLRSQKKLRYFGSVAGTAGFLDLCVSFISELKREEIWPEHFLAASHDSADPSEDGREGRLALRDKELGLIYTEYQERLHQADAPSSSGAAVAGLYDGEGRFWSARTLLKDGHQGPFRRLTLVVVDGFTDFTRTQYEILAELASRSERMLVTLPSDAEGGRKDLFAKSYAALEELREAFASCDLKETRLDLPSAKRRSVLGHLSAHLFENPRDAPKLASAKAVTVLSCVRTTGEIIEVAKRIKTLLRQGTSPDDVVVAFRSLDGVAEVVRETFQNAGLPVAIEVGRPIIATGGVRIAFSLLDLEREDWAFPRLMTLLNSSLFQPDWPELPLKPCSRAIGAFLRRFDIDRGRETILSAIERELARENRRDAIADLPAASELLIRLSETLNSFRQRAPFAEWVDTWLAIAGELGIPPRRGESIPGDEGSLLEAETHGWQAFVRLLEEAKKSEALFGRQSRSLSLSDFRKQVIELLAGQTWEEEGREDGKIRVLNAEQVRALDVPHLFLCGLNEGEFPASRGEDCFLGEAERHRLNELGLPLGHRARRSREEMLLFYGVITRARESLTLSFPSVNDSGESLNPSPFLTAVLDLIEQDAHPIERCGKLDPVPADASECTTEAETRVLAMAQALTGQVGLFAALSDRPESAQTTLNIAAAVDMATARFATRGLTNYEGLLSDPRNIKRLRQRFGPRHEFSVTELETYARSPFRFFLMSVLGLDSPSVPGPRTNYARRGSDLHSVLSLLHRRLATELSDGSGEDQFTEILRNEIARRSSHGPDSPLHRALRDIEREVLSKLAGLYAEQWRKYVGLFKELWDGPPCPTYLEIPFGNAPPDEAEDEQQENPVVEFGTSRDRIRLRGRVDRIDTGACDGRSIFNVVDYKLSRTPPRFKLEDVELGRALQLPVYSVAARRLGLVDGELFQFGFWSLSGEGFACGLKSGGKKLAPLDRETTKRIEEQLDRVLPQLVGLIREGKFPIAVDDDSDRYYPDCVAVARLASFKPLAEKLEKQLPSTIPAVAENSII